jgi:hypothetical protein
MSGVVQTKSDKLLNFLSSLQAILFVIMTGTCDVVTTES